MSLPTIFIDLTQADDLHCHYYTMVDTKQNQLLHGGCASKLMKHRQAGATGYHNMVQVAYLFDRYTCKLDMLVIMYESKI